MKKSPQQIKCSSTLSCIGHVRYLSFACNCHTQGDVDCLHWDVTPLTVHADTASNMKLYLSKCYVNEVNAM